MRENAPAWTMVNLDNEVMVQILGVGLRTKACAWNSLMCRFWSPYVEELRLFMVNVLHWCLYLGNGRPFVNYSSSVKSASIADCITPTSYCALSYWCFI